MSEPADIAPAVFDRLIDQIRTVIREELAATRNSGVSGATNFDTLLTAEEAAALMKVNRRWLYRHAARLPFTRRINRKTLRFSEAGLRRWLATKKPSSTR